MSNYNSPELEPYMVLAQEIMRRVYVETDPHTLNVWIATQLGRLGTAMGDDSFTLWHDSISQYEEIIAMARARAELSIGQRREVAWPWDTWRSLLEPLEPGMLAVISAGDGIGKTIYAENIAEFWAMQGLQVVFVHFELNKRIMWHRRAARHTGLDFRTLREGAIGKDSELKKMGQRLSSWSGGVNYLHTPGWTIEQVVQELRRRQAEGVCDVVMLDYLEKAGASNKQNQVYNNLFQREADNVEMLKVYSEAAEVPLVILTQMHKGGKSTSFSELNRTDIRGAGEKSEKANIVILLHRERQSDGTYSSFVDMRVDKNTIGKTGNVRQYMDAATFRVGDIAK